MWQADLVAPCFEGGTMENNEVGIQESGELFARWYPVLWVRTIWCDDFAIDEVASQSLDKELQRVDGREDQRALS